jgi:hypothetical protein
MYFCSFRQGLNNILPSSWKYILHNFTLKTSIIFNAERSKLKYAIIMIMMIIVVVVFVVKVNFLIVNPVVGAPYVYMRISSVANGAILILSI